MLLMYSDCKAQFNNNHESSTHAIVLVSSFTQFLVVVALVGKQQKNSQLADWLVSWKIFCQEEDAKIGIQRCVYSFPEIRITYWHFDHFHENIQIMRLKLTLLILFRIVIIFSYRLKVPLTCIVVVRQSYPKFKSLCCSLPFPSPVLPSS